MALAPGFYAASTLGVFTALGFAAIGFSQAPVSLASILC